MESVLESEEILLELLRLTTKMLTLSTKAISLLIILQVQLLLILGILFFICWFLIKHLLRRVQGEPGYVHVAFFHPYCNAGGGGERVLWSAIRALQRKYKNIKCHIYTGDTDVSPDDIILKVHDRFNIVLSEPVEFIFLHSRTVMEARHYPILTILMQSIGSLIVAADALSRFRPDIYIDTTGCAFTYPLFRFLGDCVVGCYTHYPTITTDMLQRVSDRVQAHNNRRIITESFVLTTGKLIYYHIFKFLYGLSGRCAKVIMVNSSWTHDYITALWGQGNRTHIVYPPCDTEKFKSLPFIPDSEKKIKTIISVGQFRPEKDHELQLKAFQRLCEILSPDVVESVHLVLIGGCRNEEDKKRVEELKNLALSLDIDNKVIWKLNAPFLELLESVQNGTIGLHTMWCEHFGICVVECMAGGLIMVAHDSGGPKMDIVIDYEGQRTGYRATDIESYAQVMKEILESSAELKDSIRIAARSSVDRFSEMEFEQSFLNAGESIFSNIAVRD